MTEEEWLACDDPAVMWEILWFPTVPDHIPSRVFRPSLEATAEQDRLLRLCACAFCRYDPTVSDDPAVKRSLELSEAEADKGRDEDALAFTMSWLRHHDRYDTGKLADANLPYWPADAARQDHGTAPVVAGL